MARQLKRESYGEAEKMRVLKLVLTGGAVQLGEALLEHRPAKTKLKFAGAARPTSGSA